MGQNVQVSLLCSMLKRYAYLVNSVQLRGSRLTIVLDIPDDLLPTAKALIDCVKQLNGGGYA